MKNLMGYLLVTRNPKWFKFMPDSVYLKLKYQYIFKAELDLRNPKTFTEKIQWLKIFDRDSRYPSMVDKYQAKKFIAGRVGNNYIIPTLGVWDRYDEIDFEALPNQFVLKCTHDSGGVVICNDKKQFNKVLSREKIEMCLSRNYFWGGREWPYKSVQPRIIAEEWLADNLTDYKVYCFNGKPKMVLVCSDRYKEDGLKEDFYSLDWKKLPIQKQSHKSAAIENTKPKTLNQMIHISESLAEGIPFLRVDFYEVQEKLFVGELTFYPASGFEGFVPGEWNEILGSWLSLPQ